MEKLSVFITRRIDPQAVLRLKETAAVEVWPHDDPPPHAELVRQASQVDALFTMLTDPIDQAVIDAGKSRLRVISQMAVGVDNIDVAQATQYGIPIGHTPDVLTESCADFTWALMSAIARRVTESNQEVLQGIWRPWGPEVLLGADLYQATLGIIGLGRIGLAVARRALGFNMKVLYSSRSRKPDLEKQYNLHFRELDELLQESDFVTVHTNLNPSTTSLLDAEKLGLMKPSAYLINIARGKIVDSDALTRLIQEKRIAGAALDVFDPEPIPANHPLLQERNVLITPHIASASKPVRKRMAMMCVENILKAFNQEPIPYCYNPQIYKG